MRELTEDVYSIYERDLISPVFTTRIRTINRLSRYSSPNAFDLLVCVADGHFSRELPFEEAYSSEQKIGFRAFFRKFKYLMNPRCDEIDYSADEQLLAMRSMHPNSFNVRRYLHSLLFISNGHLINIKGDLKKKLISIDNRPIVAGLVDILDCSEKRALIQILNNAGINFAPQS